MQNDYRGDKSTMSASTVEGDAEYRGKSATNYPTGEDYKGLAARQQHQVTQIASHNYPSGLVDENPNKTLF
jgi:hypothetical protein